MAYQVADIWTYYRVRIQYRNKVMGPAPTDPKMIEAWIRKGMGINDVLELRRLTVETAIELGYDVDPDATMDELFKAAEKMAGTKKTNGFKRHPEHGLYIEGRTAKAMLKEVVNIKYPSQAERWGLTRKAPTGFLAERVFVDPDDIYLSRWEPDGVLTVIGHVRTPKGERSTLAYVEYCAQPEIEFGIKVMDDCILENQWRVIWAVAQENGLGAMRSQGYGRFDVLDFEQIKKGEWELLKRRAPVRSRSADALLSGALTG